MYRHSNGMGKEKFWEMKFNLYSIKWSNLPLQNFLIFSWNSSQGKILGFYSGDHEYYGLLDMPLCSFVDVQTIWGMCSLAN
jgi:hypothetical protein